jgi:AcrR family transcriptional regulator
MYHTLDTSVSQGGGSEMVTDEGRRRDIAEALLRLAARQGLDAVSIRTVAAEAGCSVGMVQRQFQDKDGLLRFAMDHVASQLGQRVVALAPGDGTAAGGQKFLAELALQLLAVEPECRDEAMVWLAFVARAAVAPELAQDVRRHYLPAQEAIEMILLGAQTAGQLTVDVDPRPQAATLLAMIDGFTTHVLLGRVTAGHARSAVLAHIDRLFVGTPDG